MFANESKGERWPFATVYFDDGTGGIRDAKYIPSDVPEYLTDPNILISPSDAQANGGDLKVASGNWCLCFTTTCTDFSEGDTQSYFNLWYMFDKVGSSDPTVPAFPSPVSAQFAAMFPAVDQITSDTWGSAWSAIEQDLDLSDIPAFSGYGILAAQVGNGGGSTIYRLKEGTERFLIGDINTPAASTRAQSESFVRCARISNEVADYNHVPGGGNALYLAGHVSFQKYPNDEGPFSAEVGNAFAIL